MTCAPCLKGLRDIPASFDAGDESEYARALYLSCTALIRDEKLIEYDTNGDHTLNALKQPNETWTAKTIEPLFREMMFEETK